jgi:ubiquinol-cytochrome c reductase cytochrome b subunit
MPAYGKNLSPSQVTALVDFLDTLHPPGQPEAVDASREAAGVSSPQPVSSGK